MKSIGLFEAKTRLSELCREVQEDGAHYVIERRGQPIAELTPLKSQPGPQRSILEDLAAFEAAHPRPEDAPEFPAVWEHRSPPAPSPLD